MNFEMLSANYFNTTSMASVTAGTSSVINLIDNDRLKVWTGETVSSIHILFSATQSVDRIAIQNTNIKTFKLHNGTTATTFALTSTMDTATSSWTNNAETDKYLIFAATVSTIQVDLDISATTDNAVAYIGELSIAGNMYTLPINPNYSGYKPNIKPKEFIHTMSDGGISMYRIATNYQADIKLTYYTATAVTQLENIYNLESNFMITPYPTVAAWGSELYAVNWIGAFEFRKPAGNTPNVQGYNGTLRLRGIPK